MDMEHNDEWTHELGPSWKSVALGALAIIIPIGGYVVGDTLTRIQTDQREIRAVLDARSGIPQKLEHLEERHRDFEQRIRELEKDSWFKNERKR